MRVDNFLNVVPGAVKGVAVVLLGGATVAGGVFGYEQDWRAPGFAHGSVGVMAGLGAGVFMALWILCLGYVFGDARRRRMHAGLWTAAAALVPNLLGFLLYFAMRQPLPVPCPHCGQPIAAAQPFCSWCGRQVAGAVTPGATV